MKKQSTKHTSPLTDKDKDEVKVSRLDQLLTDAALATARWIKQWYKPMGIVLLVIVAGFIVTAIASSYSESRVQGVNERIHTILEKPEPGKPIDEKALESLLADVKGKPLEKIVLKAAVERLLAQTRSQPAETGMLAGGTAAPPSVPDSPAVEAAREKALSLSSEAAQRFSDDADIQLWARSIQARIESERNKAWLPAPWKFSVRAPREGDVPPETVPPETVPPETVTPQGEAPAPGEAPGAAPPTPPESPSTEPPGEGPKPEPGVSTPEGPTGEAK
ncbi:MAG TPA: hypothetical protein VMT52_06770 [Planctomycetota bacterium]|nr:hypothetical protein [Planctomycetota bacterium]